MHPGDLERCSGSPLWVEPGGSGKATGYPCFGLAGALQSDPRPRLRTSGALPRLRVGDCRVASLLAMTVELFAMTVNRLILHHSYVHPIAVRPRDVKRNC